MQRKFKISVDGRSYEVVVEEVTEASSLLPQPGDMHIPEPVRDPCGVPLTLVIELIAIDRTVKPS